MKRVLVTLAEYCCQWPATFEEEERFLLDFAGEWGCGGHGINFRKPGLAKQIYGKHGKNKKVSRRKSSSNRYSV